MTTLAPRNGINDEIINYVTRVLIKPGGRNVHTCNCAFVTSLLNADIAAERYEFYRVRNYARSVPGRLTGLDELYVPINANLNHWNFIKVSPKERKIELWDFPVVTFLTPLTSNSQNGRDG